VKSYCLTDWGEHTKIIFRLISTFLPAFLCLHFCLSFFVTPCLLTSSYRCSQGSCSLSPGSSSPRRQTYWAAWVKALRSCDTSATIHNRHGFAFQKIWIIILLYFTVPIEV
jgi:hypothetical protein